VGGNKISPSSCIELRIFLSFLNEPLKERKVSFENRDDK
jgi:hypothetical protein